MEPLVVLTRTEKVESIHKGYICITDANNSVLYNLGDPDAQVYMRSSAKPFQALPLVYSGALKRFDISLKELAIICSSHSGEDFHREAVSSILNKIGMSEDDLDCGVANPYNQDMINELIRRNERPSQLYNCCSGKHAGMLALCKYYDFPAEGYTLPEHPVQQLILDTLSELLECSAHDIKTGIDGCGIPSFMLSLRQASFLYAQLAQGGEGNGKYANCLAEISKAMTSYPRMINGDKEFCTDLISNSDGKVIGKVGGEGIYCIAALEKKLGVCIKIADGNERGVYPVAIHILRQLGVLNDFAVKKLEAWAYPPVKNHKGKVVGYTLPVFDIHRSESPEMQIGNIYDSKERCYGAISRSDQKRLY